MSFFYRLQQGLSRFMAGRYGQDAFSLFLLVCAMVLTLLSRIPILWFLYLLGVALMVWLVFRMFSRNLPKRRAENEKFLSVFRPLASVVAGKIQELRAGKYYKFYRCPACKTKLRVPKGKGKVSITCPKCRKEFVKKT